MASLLGKADATIAGMSYREAMADVAPDLKSVYQDEVLNQAIFQKGVEDHFDTLYADNNLLADQLKETTTLAMADLGTDYEGMELFNTELTSMKNRMKALPKGKKGDFERAKIRGELAELKRSTDGMEATQTTLATMIEAGDFDQHATGKVNLSLLNAIASGDAKRKIVNGKLFYSIPNPAGGEDINIDQQALKDMLIQTDPEFQGNFNKIHEGENALGKQKGNKFDRQGSVNKYEASFPSKAAFATNVNNKQSSLKYSLREALMGKDVEGTLKLDSIYETLMSMGNKENFFNGSDVDQDGDVDAADFANVDNGIALVESLTDIHSDHFDYQTAKKVAAEFYADNISAKEFQDGVNMRTKVGGKDEKTETNPYGVPKKGLRLGRPMPNGYRLEVRQDLVTSYINDIKSGTEFEFRGNKYTYVDGGWIENEGGMFRPGEPAPEFKIGDTQSLTDRAFENGGKYFDGLVTEVEIDARTGKVTTANNKTKDSVKEGLVSKYSTPDLRVDMSFMNNDDDYIGTNLNKLLPAEFESGNKNGYKFEVDKLDGSIFALLGDDPFREAVALKDNDGNVLTYPEGHEYEGKNVIIKTGGNVEERKQAIATLNDILETFGFDKYINTGDFEL